MRSLLLKSVHQKLMPINAVCSVTKILESIGDFCFGDTWTPAVRVQLALEYQHKRKAKKVFSITNTIKSIRIKPFITNLLAVAHKSQKPAKKTTR